MVNVKKETYMKNNQNERGEFLKLPEDILEVGHLENINNCSKD